MQAARWITQLAVTDLHRLPGTGFAWRRRSTDATTRATARSRATGAAVRGAIAGTGNNPIRPRARISIRVARDQAEPLRRALFRSLQGRIKQLVIVLGCEPDAQRPTAELQLLLERSAVDDAFIVAKASAPDAKPGEVIFL